MSYSESLRLNVDELKDTKIDFLNPFIPYDDKEALKKRLYEHLVTNRRDKTDRDLPTKSEISDAVNAA